MMTVIRRRDPERRMARFHLLALQGTLAGACDLVHEWGRIGCAGTVRTVPHDTQGAALAAAAAYEDRKRRKGYR